MNNIWDAKGTQHNFVIDTGFEMGSAKSLFLDDDMIHIMSNGSDMYDLLVKVAIFTSKGQARKANVVPQIIPPGWSTFGPIGKRKHQLFVWNPQEK